MALPAGGAGSGQLMRVDEVSKHVAAFLGPVGDDNRQRGCCDASSAQSHISYGKGLEGNSQTFFLDFRKAQPRNFSENGESWCLPQSSTNKQSEHNACGKHTWGYKPLAVGPQSFHVQY